MFFPILLMPWGFTATRPLPTPELKLFIGSPPTTRARDTAVNVVSRMKYQRSTVL
jgi:hypothetical protein